MKQKKFLFPIFLVFFTFLWGCGQNNESSIETGDSQIPQTQIQGENALLSLYSIDFLLRKGPLYGRSARESIFSFSLLDVIDQNTESPFALLEQLEQVLRTDIQALLNKEVNRANALNDYIARLELIAAKAAIRMKILESQESEIRSLAREQQILVREKDRALRKALQEEDFRTAEEIQRDLLQDELILSQKKTEEQQLSRTVGLYEGLLKVSEDRHEAIERNREVLIAGLKVIKVPGIDDLGILQTEGFSSFFKNRSRIAR